MRLATFLLVLIPAQLVAAEPAVTTETLPDGRQRWSFPVTYGDEDCPEPEADEIVVCARLPESERYRIPAPLRTPKRDTPAMGASWTAQVESHENIARLTRPDSCSVVGTYGYTGCTAAALRQWFAERQLIEAGE